MITTDGTGILYCMLLATVEFTGETSGACPFSGDYNGYDIDDKGFIKWEECQQKADGTF